MTVYKKIYNFTGNELSFSINTSMPSNYSLVSTSNEFRHEPIGPAIFSRKSIENGTFAWIQCETTSDFSSNEKNCQVTLEENFATKANQILIEDTLVSSSFHCNVTLEVPISQKIGKNIKVILLSYREVALVWWVKNDFNRLYLKISIVRFSTCLTNEVSFEDYVSFSIKDRNDEFDGAVKSIVRKSEDLYEIIVKKCASCEWYAVGFEKNGKFLEYSENYTLATYLRNHTLQKRESIFIPLSLDGPVEGYLLIDNCFEVKDFWLLGILSSEGKRRRKLLLFNFEHNQSDN